MLITLINMYKVQILHILTFVDISYVSVLMLRTPPAFQRKEENVT